MFRQYVESQYADCILVSLVTLFYEKSSVFEMENILNHNSFIGHFLVLHQEW